MMELTNSNLLLLPIIAGVIGLIIALFFYFAVKAKPPFQKPAGFFSRFRSLCAGAYYTTPAGWNAIGYVGNVPLAKFDGPPAEVLEKLGVTQTVV